MEIFPEIGPRKTFLVPPKFGARSPPMPATVIFFTKGEGAQNLFNWGQKALSNQYARTNYRRFSLTCRGPIVWNNIPNNICNLRTFAQFKFAWRKYMTYVDQ